MQGTITEDLTAVNQVLVDKVGRQKYRIWFKDSTKLMLSEDYLTIGVPNHFVANWIESHFSEEINEAVRAVTGENRKITFAIDSDLTNSRRKEDFRKAAVVTARPAIQQGASALSPVPAVSPKPGRMLKYSLDSFVTGSSNELAYNAARMVAKEQQSPFNPLFIHGGYGVGKTHLAQGICNFVNHDRPRTAWLYLSAEDFANRFILALKTRKLEAFRRRMRRTDLLVIDDVHFLANKPSTQEEFLHTFNTIDLANKQVVLVSDAHPKMIRQLSEKLVNRFVSGMVVKIDSPDFQTRCQICRQHAANINKSISENVIKFIAEHMKTNVRELEGALLKLVAIASLQDEKITLNLAKHVMEEYLSRADPIVHVSDIESVVSSFFGITPALLHSPKKDKTVSLARHFSMYLARKHTKMSSTEIGRCMGGKNHATVLLACKKIEQQVEQDSQLNWNGAAGNRVSKAKTILNRLENDIAR